MKPGARRLVLTAIAILAALAARDVAAIVGIAISTNSSLGFGQIVATSTPGSVTVATNGVRSASGGVALGNGFSVSAAAFTVTGEPNTAYSITLPASVSLSGGSGSMTVDGFTSTPAGSGNLGPSGTQTISVGATLQVGASQAPASYSGTYAVTVAYQ